jgi:sensor domain CHASE-containing protein
MFYDPIGSNECRYTTGPRQARNAPKNEATSLVYKLLIHDSASVTSAELPYVLEAIEVLTYYGKTVIIAAGGVNVNHYTLRIGNKDGK